MFGGLGEQLFEKRYGGRSASFLDQGQCLLERHRFGDVQADDVLALTLHVDEGLSFPDGAEINKRLTRFVV